MLRDKHSPITIGYHGAPEHNLNFWGCISKGSSSFQTVAIDVGVAGLEADGDVEPVGSLPAGSWSQVHGQGTKILGLNLDDK